RLHEKHRVGEERRRHEDRGHDGERGHLREGHSGGDGRAQADVLARRRRHEARPKRPAGRTSSTTAMMTKITVFDASGEKTFVKPSTTPRPKPVTIDPMIEPRPPMTTTANTTMMRSAPISGFTWEIGAASTPASAACPWPKP